MSGTVRIGAAINASVKPSRDFLLALEGAVSDRNGAGGGVGLKFFLGSSATTPANFVRFAASGVDVLVFCGLARELVFRCLDAMPGHPPVVFCTYSAVSEEEFARFGRCAVVMRDNVALGRRAAEFFLRRGLRNFAFLGRNGYREDIAGDIRERAYRERLEAEGGAGTGYSSLMIGTFEENEDYWETEREATVRWLRSLPLPCGLFVNGDHLAFRTAEACRRTGIAVPDGLEILGMNNQDGFCERAVPAISSLLPSFDALARQALELALELAGNPAAGRARRTVMVGECVLEERGSTSFGRGYGQVAVRAREFIRLNVPRGITVADVVAAAGVSRRTLELRVKEATGKSVRDLIIDARMEKICGLLATTELPIGRVVEAAGCPGSSSVHALFKKRYGVAMGQYRKAQGRRDASSPPAAGEES